MSDLSLLIGGKLTPDAFITKVAGELQADLKIFGPVAPVIEQWALAALTAYLSTKLSPTLVALIVGEIRQLLGLPAAT